MKKAIIAVFIAVIATTLTGCDLINKSKQETLEPEEAKTLAQTFINENLMPAGAVVTIGEIIDENGIYKLPITFPDNSTQDSYITKDGKVFFPEAINIAQFLSDKANAQANTAPTTNNTTMDLEIETLVEGTGEQAVQSGDSITVHYTGTLEDGTKFDSSLDRGEPFTFTIGEGAVIQGWEQGLIGMVEGEQRRLTIPAELGYGSAGAGDIIPPDATLLFDIELISIN